MLTIFINFISSKCSRTMTMMMMNVSVDSGARKKCPVDKNH